MREIKEALERLRPTIGARADILWALYVSADREARQDLEQSIRLLGLQRNATGPSRLPTSIRLEVAPKAAGLPCMRRV